MAFAIQGKLEGLGPVVRRLQEVGRKSTRTAILRKAVNAATGPLLKSAKAMCPVSEDPPLKKGLLRKSLGRKLSYNKRSGVVTGLVGPRRGFKVQVGVRKKGKRPGSPIYQDPVRYAHLVELGTRRAGPKPFLRPAWDGGKAAALATVAASIRDGIARAAR